jgi:hypothetical protein
MKILPAVDEIFYADRETERYDEGNTAEPRFTNASNHEQIGSRTNFSKKKSRLINGISSNEHASRQQRLATSCEDRRKSVGCCVTSAQYT